VQITYEEKVDAKEVCCALRTVVRDAARVEQAQVKRRMPDNSAKIGGDIQYAQYKSGEASAHAVVVALRALWC